MLHLADLQPAGDLDELGQEILRAHVEALSPTPREAWQEAETLAKEFSEVIDRLPEETPDRAVLVEISAGIEAVSSRRLDGQKEPSRRNQTWSVGLQTSAIFLCSLAWRASV